jgi:hypothetical protein
MKKLLLLLTLTFSIFSQGQDYETIARLQSTNFDDAIKIANDINGMAKNKYHLYKYHEFENERILKFVFAPEGVTDEQLNASNDYSNCLTLQFKIRFEGENKDLEIVGVKKYVFDKMNGKYLDLFPVWKNWFKKESDIENTLKDIESRELIDYSKKISYYLQRNGADWILINDN